MDADVTNISDSLTYNQFSGQMVIALFLQILIMIIDRYMYKAKTFIAVQEKELEKHQVTLHTSPLKKIEQSEIQKRLLRETDERGKSF